MSIERDRSEDWFLNAYKLDKLTAINERNKADISKHKYLYLTSNELNNFSSMLELLESVQIDLKDKIFAVSVDFGCYLTSQQCQELLACKSKVEGLGAQFKIKDGQFWELEEVSVVASQLDKVVEKIKSSTIEENGKIRKLNELEKFLWAYSFVANRKYQENNLDKDSSRHITSILNTGDCVCVGFSAILKELCDRLNIECYLNSCVVFNKNDQQEYGHANNVVVINGAAYHCDTCWDCVSKNNEHRTFANCLVSFEDKKDAKLTKSYNVTAPFCDVKADLKDIKSKFEEINNIENITYDDYVAYTGYKNAIHKYIKLIPEKQISDPFAMFTGKLYADKLKHYYVEAIKMIEQKIATKGFTIEEFENALNNIYISMGNSPTSAKEKTKLDIDSTIQEAGRIYLDTSSNCFAQEYNQRLEV